MNRLRSILLHTTSSANPFTIPVNSLSALSSRLQTRTVRMEASTNPLSGLWKPNHLQGIYYGSGTVSKNLLSCLPSDKSKAFIVTGSSLATKTPLIKDVENLLTPSRHAGTFSNIKQHAPVAQLDEATELIGKDSSVDTIISIGGGSPMDSAKAIVYRLNEKSGKLLRHITIPTTLSVAEGTSMAGFTQANGEKTGVAHPDVYPSYILYDSKFALHTPPHLFASTGIRALDHAVEMQYHPYATEMPTKWMSLMAIRELFTYLPQYKKNPKDEDVILKLFLGVFSSLGFLGLNWKGGLGMSHTMGYALGSPYGIPHGTTSCLTLGDVVKIKASLSKEDAGKIARILDFIPEQKRTGDDSKDAQLVGDLILKLVEDLGFKTTLTEQGVGRDQVDTICKRAVGGLNPDKEMSEEQKKQMEVVRKLVERLF